MKNIENVAVIEKLQVQELEVTGNSLEEIKRNIRKAIDKRVEDILSVMELAASAGKPEDIVRYNNAIQNKNYVKQDMAQKFIEQAEKIWMFNRTYVNSKG